MSPRRLLCVRARQFAAAGISNIEESVMCLRRMQAAAHRLSAHKLRESGEALGDACILLEQLAEELDHDAS